MNIKEFTIFHYKWFACLKDCVFWLILFVITPSPLSASLLFNSLVLFLSPSPSLSFWRFLCIFFFRKRKDSFSPIISSFIPIFHLFVPLLSLLFWNPKQVSIFLSQGSQDSLHFLIFFFFSFFEEGAPPFALISLKFSKWTTSREKKASERERERKIGGSSPPRR